MPSCQQSMASVVLIAMNKQPTTTFESAWCEPQLVNPFVHASMQTKKDERDTIVLSRIHRWISADFFWALRSSSSDDGVSASAIKHVSGATQ